MKRFPVEGLTALYLVFYVPYIVMTRWLATSPSPVLGRPLSGIEILPATLILSGIMTFAFAWLSGWWKKAHLGQAGPFTFPRPTGWTLISGVCTAFVLFTVPLSFTFPGVSVAFIQVLMRGDVLIVAPLVDLVTGRKVRWYSWVALALAVAGIALTLKARGGFNLPPLAIAAVALYTVGYFGRLLVMTRTAKDDDPDRARGYFVEEKLVAYPVALVVLAVITALGIGGPIGGLSFGFVGVWASGQVLWLTLLSALLFAISVFSALILLDARENTFCVPLERSASILAGIAAAWWLAVQFAQPYPTAAEMGGAVLLVLAVTVLSLGPRLRAPAGAEAKAEAP